MNRMSNWLKAGSLSLAMPLVVSALGCAVAPAGDETQKSGESVGATTEAFGGYWVYTQNVYSATSLDLGVDTNKSCFLAGVSGNLSSWAGLETVTQGTYIAVDRRNGHYFLDISPSADGASVAGIEVGAKAICLPTVTNRTAPVFHIEGYSNAAPTLLAPATKGRQCFLTGIQNTYNFSDPKQAFQHAGDSLRVYQSGGNWYLTATGVAAGYAACVDVNGAYNPWEWIAPSSGTINEPLASTSGGVQCLLSGIGGNFQQGNSWADGVDIGLKSSAQWQMTVSNGKTGWSTCVW
ncbi:MAG: hypothetical protein ACHREM_32475 [Polyangiales bacterium]